MSTNAGTRLTSEILGQKNSISGLLQLDPIRDLPVHHDTDGDSFWVVSHLKDGGESFTVLVHIMLLYRSPIGPVGQVAISILDEGTNDYFSQATSCRLVGSDYSLSQATAATRETVSQTRLEVFIAARGLSGKIDEMTAHLSGTMDKMTVEANSPGKLSISMELSALGPILPY